MVLLSRSFVRGTPPLAARPREGMTKSPGGYGGYYLRLTRYVLRVAITRIVGVDVQRVNAASAF
jgi:hypothetical protein